MRSDLSGSGFRVPIYPSPSISRQNWTQLDSGWEEVSWDQDLLAREKGMRLQHKEIPLEALLPNSFPLNKSTLGYSFNIYLECSPRHS